MLNRSRLAKIFFTVVAVLIGTLLFRGTVNAHWQNVKARKVGLVSSEVDSKAQNKLVQTLTHENYIGSAEMYKNGKKVASYYSGYSDAKNGIKNYKNTMYEIDSIQKSITAVLIMQQVEKHRLTLSDRLSMFYPGIPGSRNITIRQMLNMTSGLSMQGSVGPNAVKSDSEIIQSDISRVRYHNEMNGRWDYQAVNFNFLSGILEKITHQSYQQLFYGQIIKKLRLKHTAFAYDLPNCISLASGYYGKNDIPEVLIYTKPSGNDAALEHDELGTGQVYMSVGDLYRVESAILAGKIVSAQSLHQLYQGGSNTKYEAGFYTQGRVKLTNGAGYGFESSIHISPNGKNAIILLSNYQEPLFKVSSLAKSFDQLLINTRFMAKYKESDFFSNTVEKQV
ncbi:serine hydrolase [Loigolactobacillus backii]|uniref:serine hydrolase domain-containing protein n=1 Tax=Loigolactobacillus backii TaxID=375175 RepID=UPI000C1CB6C5|nr:serine hydrolase domain-containing protein [Loigolactobacillus backii]PIO84253.1 serine hydrolase [Loigolactobacillus backii]